MAENIVKDEAKERVETELLELKEKIVKLSDFLFGTKIAKANISLRMRSLLRTQLDSMQRYAEVLQERLVIWGKTDEELLERVPRCC